MLSQKKILLFIVLCIFIFSLNAKVTKPQLFEEDVKKQLNDENYDNSQDEYIGKKYFANKQISYTIVQKFYRKNQYFTQGLSFLKNDILLESSGTHGGSYLQTVNYRSSEIINQVKLGDNYFGEGSDMIKVDNKQEFYFLTWKQRQVFVYDNNFKLQRKMEIPKEMKEGWGLTHIQNEKGDTIFLATDGSYKIFHVDPKTFKVIKTVLVQYQGQNVSKLNEIEIYKGTLLANTFLSPYIYQIDYNSGNVIQKLDFSVIVNDLNTSKGYENFTKKEINYCLNGIAYNQETDVLIITGKMWPWFYQVKLYNM